MPLTKRHHDHSPRIVLFEAHYDEQNNIIMTTVTMFVHAPDAIPDKKFNNFFLLSVSAPLKIVDIQKATKFK